ncbi:hypothetical protein DDB_G0270924 [Dictyostelium discoideum AX4]|uniref:Uncharacterized protein n=1 Tax=Dictyostelium discoideum TaxID=44689 RepID=Q55DB8_DICDI|nr:hypothetical protein DDB_G0270924 [Dictyostelium discoideum AX4]EAL72812.1 hypothetical protein DDB_G0270924 [Dictyostelium discoideum AX4]|eukprot:XP_646213.1 hypothetical protein DDB_G0270924 [Dictyostelium discoideum AX4]
MTVKLIILHPKEYIIEAGKSQKNVKTNPNPSATSINIENLSKSDDGRIRIISTSFPMEEDFISPISKITIKKKYNKNPIEIMNLGTTVLKISIE